MEALLKVEKLFKSGLEEDRERAITKARNIATRSLLDYIDNANNKVVRPLPNYHIPFSPELKMARQAVRAASKDAREEKQNTAKQNKLHAAKQEKKVISRSAPEHRREFLQGRISEMAETQKCSESSAKKQILDCEQSKELFSMNRLLMHGPRQSTMASVLVPNGKEGPNQGWTPITDTETKEKVLLDYNARHLQQSNISPFVHGPLQEVIGHDAHNCGVLNSGLTEEEIQEIAGNYGHLQDALSEVLRQLKYRLDEEGKKLEFKWIFDEEDFKEAFGKARYNIAPGFSGLSMAHLRTITKDANLSKIYPKILELPFRYGFTYDHWLKSVQALLQKETLPFIT